MIPVQLKVTGVAKLLERLKRSHSYYMDLHDNGGARFSNEAAQAFKLEVVTNIVTGKYDSQFTSSGKGFNSYQSRMQKGSKGGGSPWGIFSGQMVHHIHVFRSRYGGDALRRGHVVGVRPNDGFYRLSAIKLGVFEKGGIKKGWADGIHQKPRPIMQLSLQDFMRSKFPSLLIKAQRGFRDIWRI